MAPRRSRTKKSSTLVLTSKGLVAQPRKAGKSRKGGATKTAPNRIPTQAPTLEAIQKSLQRIHVTGPRQQMSEYMHCRLDPYTSKGQTAIPDGRNNKFVVVDHFVADDILCEGTSGFSIATFPFLPYTAGIIGNGGPGLTNIAVNGITFINPNYAGNGLYPLGVPKEWGQWIANSYAGIALNDPYNSAGARIVSVTRRLIYLSPAQTATGIITVTPQKLSVTQGQTINSVTPGTGVYGTLMDPTSTSVFNPGVGTSIAAVDYNFNLAATTAPPFDRSSVTTRVENGVLITGKHLGEMHKLSPVFDNIAFPCANTTLASNSQAIGLFTTATPAATTGGGIVWYDDEWESQTINVTGVISGAHFRLETIVCMEYTVGTLSPVFAFSRSPTKPDLPLIQAVEKKVNSMPVARPGVTV
jgi:hypothetical protein